MKHRFSYEVKLGYRSGKFSIYQSKSGAIYMSMGDAKTILSATQLRELYIDCYDLIDFDINGFDKFYGHLPKSAMQSCYKKETKNR